MLYNTKIHFSELARKRLATVARPNRFNRLLPKRKMEGLKSKMEGLKTKMEGLAPNSVPSFFSLSVISVSVFRFPTTSAADGVKILYIHILRFFAETALKAS